MTPPLTDKLLRCLLHQGMVLRCSDKNDPSNWVYELTYTPADTSFQLLDQTINDSDLACLHAFLPGVAHALLGTPDSTIHPGLLDNTLFYLEDSTPCMFNAARSARHSDLLHVREFQIIKLNWKNKVDIQVSYLQKVHASSDCPIYSTKLAYITRSISYMNKHYPEWQQRMQLCDSLGMGKVATANFVLNFRQDPVFPASVPMDITMIV